MGVREFVANESRATSGHVGGGAKRRDLELKLGGESVTLSRATAVVRAGTAGQWSAGDLGLKAGDRQG